MENTQQPQAMSDRDTGDTVIQTNSDLTEASQASTDDQVTEEVQTFGKVVTDEPRITDDASDVQVVTTEKSSDTRRQVEVSTPEPQPFKIDKPAPIVQPQTVSKVALMIQQQIQNYVEAMSAKAPDPVQGGQWQKTLFSLLKQVLSSTDPAKFREEWNAILNAAYANREGVFHENYIFRFPQHWNLSDAESTIFRRLITLIKMTCDPQNRFQQGNAIQLERGTAGLTETQKNNILNFYN